MRRTQTVHVPDLTVGEKLEYALIAGQSLSESVEAECFTGNPERHYRNHNNWLNRRGRR